MIDHYHRGAANIPCLGKLLTWPPPSLFQGVWVPSAVFRVPPCAESAECVTREAYRLGGLCTSRVFTSAYERDGIAALGCNVYAVEQPNASKERKEQVWHIKACRLPIAAPVKNDG